MRGRAREPRAHTRAHLRQGEGLADVVGEAGGECLGHVVLTGAAGEHDERCVPVAVHRAQSAAGLESVEARHEDVHEHEVVSMRGRLGHRVLTVIDRIDVVAVAVQHRLEDAHQRDVVVGDQDPRARGQERSGRLDLDHRCGGALVEHELLALGRRDDAQRESGRGHTRLRVSDHVVDARIVAVGVMVKEHQRPNPGGEGDVDRVLDRAVAPTRLVRQLATRVLRVVHEDVGALEELDVALVAGVRQVRRIERSDRTICAPGWVGVRLVVGAVHEGGRPGRHAVADARRGVVDELARDVDAPDRELGLVELDEVESRGEGRERHREVGVVHRAAHGLRQGAVDPGGAVDRELAARRERRQEEGQSLDVIAVCVREEQVRAKRALGAERQPELPRAGAGVEDQARAVVGRHLDAGGVAAETDRLGTGRGDGSARAPEADADVSGPRGRGPRGARRDRASPSPPSCRDGAKRAGARGRPSRRTRS